MKTSPWKYLLSFVSEQSVEKAGGPVAGDIEVSYVFGKYVIDGKQVNYGFGNLDTVFRKTLERIRFGESQFRDILILGLGAGNILKIIEEEYAGAYSITGVEADSEMIRLGKKYFKLGERKGLQLREMNAELFVKQMKESWDMILVDLFVDEQVPRFAEEIWFLQKMRESLRNGGSLLFNRLGHTDRLEQESLLFSKKMNSVLPGSDYFYAHTNLMLHYQKK